jgi:hypothetical protein
MICGNDNKFQTINLLTHKESNNVMKYKSDIINYGHQRFYNIDMSNKTAV